MQASGNLALSQVEQVKKFIILERDFSQEYGELTPTMKMKRKDIQLLYSITVFSSTFPRN
jgi:long-chain acyl-CoA synthetase